MPRILIVDDDGETCRFMSELLEQPDREIRTTQKADEALHLAREPFDLLISDINLDAQQTGMDVLRAFKTANPSGQVVLISGFGTDGNAQHGISISGSGDGPVVLTGVGLNFDGNSASGTCEAPTVFRSRSDGYAFWKNAAASQGRSWKDWSEDEPCPQRGAAEDLVADAAAVPYCQLPGGL